MTGRPKKWSEISEKEDIQETVEIDTSQKFQDSIELNSLLHQQHFQTIFSSGYFDVEYYLAKYPDIQISNLHPISHYLTFGAATGNDPSVLFSTSFYLARYPDVRNSGMNPLLHYVLFGIHENRKPLPKLVGKLDLDFEDLTFEVTPRYLTEDETSSTIELPLISVIIPCKNRTDYLLTAISSVLNQTYTNFEIIVVDDHSDLPLKEFLKGRITDSRLFVINNLGHGPCAARNLGLDTASGDYVTFLDSDNEWLSNFLENSLKAIRVSGADAVYSNLAVFNDENELIYILEKGYSYEELLWLNYIDLNTLMHRKFEKERVRFSENIKRLNDWDYVLQIAKVYNISYANFDELKYLQSNVISQISNSESLAYLNVVRNNHFLDWNQIDRTLNDREIGLISIVILHHGKAELTHNCLTSIFNSTYNLNFEIILIDNQNDSESKALSHYWTSHFSQIRAFSLNENLNFAFGSNYGFSQTKGEFVVFLNNDVLVTPDWLSSLMEILTEESVIGVQPKLLYPDGRIQNIGNVFSDKSFVPYPIYRDLQGDLQLSMRPRLFTAITGACLMLRAKDFSRAKGFDPIFINGMEDTDLCLRLGSGNRVFKVVPDSLVIHLESQSPNRSLNIHQNRLAFLDRYRQKDLSNDQVYYSEDSVAYPHLDVHRCCDIDHKLGTVQPKYDFGEFTKIDGFKHKIFSEYEFAIRIGCPSPDMAKHWGDYHYSVALVKAFARKGIRARIDFLDSWADQSPTDINLVLRGLSEFKPVTSALDILWVISHPELVSPNELSRFDIVFLASKKLPEESSYSQAKNLKYLPQATDVSRFFPRPINPNYQSHALYVANSRKIERTAARLAKELGIELEVYGQHWEDLIPNHWIKNESMANSELPHYYTNSSVVISDHWDSQIEYGIASNRLFDVLSCNGKLLSDNMESIPQELIMFVTGFTDSESFQQGFKELSGKYVGSYSNVEESPHNVIARLHSFDKRVDQILAEILSTSQETFYKTQIFGLKF